MADDLLKRTVKVEKWAMHRLTGMMQGAQSLRDELRALAEKHPRLPGLELAVSLAEKRAAELRSEFYTAGYRTVSKAGFPPHEWTIVGLKGDSFDLESATQIHEDEP